MDQSPDLQIKFMHFRTTVLNQFSMPRRPRRLIGVQLAVVFSAVAARMGVSLRLFTM